ncbi:MAG: beta-lactamase family protein [Sandaracinus sp.]|nr:beta-lactamase family protein [Sandaracinus sp.]MCB9623420.1 beta-lactamase family protein [Sandaracinus sp.]MCB9636322.1 beta-lactamase family protein [Sandaracinus sp.]
MIEAGVAGTVFPGASSCVAWRENGTWVYAEAAGGRLAYQAPKVEPKTPYDLASITKSFVATTALRLVEAGRLSLSSTVHQTLSDARGGAVDQVTVEQLLTHRSGLAAWGGLYLDVPHDPGTTAARRWILAEAARRPEEGPPGRCIYSDLGYMLAGEIVARAAGSDLAEAVADHVTRPLGIEDRIFYAGALSSERRAALVRVVAPTERCEWRGRIVRGEVHDENCSALGGVSGHAGLFGTARGVARFGVELLDALGERTSFLSKATLTAALTERPGGSYRLGFDVKAAEGSAAGRRMSTRTFGHLGFTGTSLWCDPERDVVVVLLTNRVHPSRANEKIRGFRPAFHDGVLAAWEDG